MKISNIYKTKSLLMICVMAVLAFLGNTFYAAAQDANMQQFVSEREFFTVQVPVGWQTTEVVPGAALVTANSSVTLDRYKAGDVPESGDFVVTVGFLPYNVVRAPQVASLNIQYDASPEVFLQSMLPLFRISDGATVSEAELVSVSDTREVGQVTVSADGQEGIILVFHAADGVVAFVSTSGFPGETADFQEFAYAIAAGTEFLAPQNTLWGVMIGR